MVTLASLRIGLVIDMTEQEEKVLKLCRYWYQTASDISRQTLWYEIGVLLENERGLTKRAPDLWDSAPLQALSTPEADTIAGHLSTPPTSG